MLRHCTRFVFRRCPGIAAAVTSNHLRNSLVYLHSDPPHRINAEWIKQKVILLKKIRQKTRQRTETESKLVRDVMGTEALDHMIQLLYSCSQARIMLGDKHFIAFNSLLQANYKGVSANKLGRVLYGLGSATSDSASVRQYLATISNTIIAKNKLKIKSPIGISMSFHGLKKMSSEHAEVRSVVHHLQGMIKKSGQSFDAQAIGNILYGLQGMSSEHAEVRALVSALSAKVSESQELLDAQAVGNALYGLQGMSSEHAEVRALVSALSAKVSESQELLKAQAVGNALYGLQGMSSEHAEVRALVSALSAKVSESQELLDAQHVGNALYGLILMSKNEFSAVENLVVYLLTCINEEILCTFYSLDLFRSLSLLKFYNADFFPIAVLDRVNALLTILSGSISELSAQSCCTPAAGSQKERRVADVVSSYLLKHRPEAVLTRNEMLEGFEADIVIRLAGKGRKECCRVINIEVDGPKHQFPTKQTFTARRDQYLTQQFGHSVYRIDITKLDRKRNLHDSLLPLLDEIFGK